MIMWFDYIFMSCCPNYNFKIKMFSYMWPLSHATAVHNLTTTQPNINVRQHLNYCFNFRSRQNNPMNLGKSKNGISLSPDDRWFMWLSTILWLSDSLIIIQKFSFQPLNRKNLLNFLVFILLLLWFLRLSDTGILKIA